MIIDRNLETTRVEYKLNFESITREFLFRQVQGDVTLFEVLPKALVFIGRIRLYQVFNLFEAEAVALCCNEGKLVVLLFIVLEVKDLADG